MGSGWSCDGLDDDNDKRKKRGETEEEYRLRRRLAKQQQQAGILAPPIFLHSQESSSLSLSTLAQLAQSQHPPNLIEHLWTTDFGSRLLKEYVTPGFSLQLPTSVHSSSSSTNQKNQILIHLQPATTSSSILLAQHQFGPLQVQLNVPATTSSSSSTTGSSTLTHQARAGPLLQLAAATPSPYVSLHAGIPLQQDDTSENNDNGGWMETKFKARTTSGFDLVASAWMGMQDVHRLCQGGGGVAEKPKVHLQCGIDHQEALLAVQTKLPLDFSFSSQPPIEYLMSIDLNHRRQDADVKINDASDAATTTTSSPNPLWLSLKHQSHNRSNSSSNIGKTCWALNLSQLVHFDRINLNPVDERAPQIRQSCAWAIQMEKIQQPQQHDNSNKKHTSGMITWSAAASMQWNRHLGTKVVWQDAAQALTVAAVLRQWEEPRVTLSLMHQWSRNNARGWTFGLEVQPLSSSSSASKSKTGQQRRQGPPTQILLPD